MPCYNAAAFLKDAIESVIIQTYMEWELLIIDDCSLDNSVSIIKEYQRKENRIRFFTTKLPSGSPAIPRNIGIDQAKGRYIAFLDSDDVWLPTKLQEQVSLFEDSHVAVVFSNYEKMAEDGTCSGRMIIAPQKACYRSLLRGNVIGNVTGIYDTQKVGKIFFQDVHHEDYVLWLSILKQGYIAVNTNTVTALYRLRKNSVSSNKMNVLSWQWNIYVNIEKIGFLKSAYFFMCYVYKALKKTIK